ncbi:MAG: AAA family ATPase, partial [Caldilineaceae bacterium]|nr:AAA family ATPase [Caldilineaceae bacterium]
MNTTQLMRQEARLINRMFQRNDVRAKVDPRQTVNVAVGYISYGLQLPMNERFAKVEGLQRELSNLLTNHRQRSGIPGSIQVIPVSTPRLALEVPHPQPEPLLWSPRKTTTTAAHTMLIGRSFLNGPQDERIAFDDAPHTLICGITGAGKSVLLQTMLLSLCAGTSPDELRLVLIDLKNEDLVPFERLPHVETFAGTRESAVSAIESVVREKDRRIAQRGHKPHRLVLVIDEMAQLAGMPEVKEALGDLASIGRSKWINLIGATQHPTDKGGLGSMLKANFPVRLVGMVAPGQSHIATGRPATHADLLPGKGAFLRCQGPDVYRFQSFYIEPADVAGMAKYIAKDIWQRQAEPREPVHKEKLSSLVCEPLEPPREPVHEPLLNRSAEDLEPPREPLFPLQDKRPLNDREALLAWRMIDELSKSELCRQIYGAKSG